MKISSTLEKTINEQINHELQSHYDYLAIAAWFETTPYAGFASWMQKQSAEEQEHAMKFFNYLNDRGGTVVLSALVKPKAKYKSVVEAFKHALAQEQKITKLIHKLYAQAEKELDYETRHFLSWFLQEQVEEEKSAQDMIDRLELVGDSPHALLRLDAIAAARE